MPDKAIDLVDEACAMVRTEIDSMPTELDVITRREKAAIGDVRGLREAIEQVRRDIDGLNGSTI